jgi:tetratricopeptide (TPR) repeat protein
LSTDKEKILNSAQKYILKGKPQKAIKEYQKLIKVFPNDARIHLKLGDLYLKNGENEKAIEEHLKVAELYVEEDLNIKAISIYKKILSINPKHIEAIQKIAKLYLKEGLRGDAKNYYQSILVIRPDDREALDALKRIENHQFPKEVVKNIPSEESPLLQYSAEENSFAESSNIPLSPNIQTSNQLYVNESTIFNKDLEMHYHLGIAYKEMELYDYAISEFELAASNPIIQFDCYIMLGDCLKEKGAYDKSIEYYKKASAIKDLSKEKLAILHFNLGLAYEANGMISEALNTFNLVLKLDHSFLEANEKIKKLQQKWSPTG